ncbi:hypothetical protein T4E_8838 [Trichinella pseudospiralis]|uniref:Uncharacterized protein n=1 Tax=Trichinella pseudospiralis TaxID=6337 RepID=A0A0V0XED3_TRIPS|nr:hypothetical protein T4E_8838 [Trichinella pseudospiralis]
MFQYLSPYMNSRLLAPQLTGHKSMDEQRFAVADDVWTVSGIALPGGV